MVETLFFLAGVLVGAGGYAVSVLAYRRILKSSFHKPHVPDTIPEDWLE